MRHIIDIIDTALVEGVGLARRKPGEQFKNSQGDVVIFQGLDFFPDRGNFRTPEQLVAGLEQAYAQYGISPADVYWTNQPGSAMLAFAVAHFTDQANKDYYLGRYFKNISPNRMENSFPHDAIPGDFKYQSAVGVKEQSGLKPSEVLTKFDNQTPDSIYQQIAEKFGSDGELTQATQAFMSLKSFPLVIKKGSINFTAFRDYFCELWQPMALVMGKPVSGNASEAAEIFFGKNADYSDCVISFNNNAIGGLYDSLLVNGDGRQIKLSSKGKDGASASVSNLERSVRELEKTAQGKRILKKYDQEIAILDLIRRVDARNGPLDLAIMFDLITDNEKNQILSLRNLTGRDPVIGKKILSPKLEKWFKERSFRDIDRMVPLDHMIAAVAYHAADLVNTKTNFSQAAADILNHSAVVQIYTDAKESQDTITVQGFTAVYPSKTFTGVLLDPTKVYYSTGNNGKYTFTILKNGASAKDVKLNVIQTDTEPDIPRDILDQPQKRSSVRASDSVRQAPKSDRSIYGRTRR